MPDSLEAFLNREVILLAGGPGSGKSFSVAKLCQDGLEEGFNVVVVDRDRGLAKAVQEVCGTIPENLDYFLADEWSKIPAAIDHAFNILGPNDWFVFEMLGGIWESAQTEFSRLVYGEKVIDRILSLRAAAQKTIDEGGLTGKDARKEMGRQTGFKGLDGIYDWVAIRDMHNYEAIERVILRGNFNVLSTTSLTQIREGDEYKYPEFSALGQRPEGEKHTVYRHDTVAVVQSKGGKYLARTDMGNGRGKERGGRKKFRDLDITDLGFIRAYKELHCL